MAKDIETVASNKRGGFKVKLRKKAKDKIDDIVDDVIKELRVDSPHIHLWQIRSRPLPDGDIEIEVFSPKGNVNDSPGAAGRLKAKARARGLDA